MLEHLPKTDGFFQLHHLNVRKEVDDVTLKNFTNLEGDSLRVAFLANIPQIRSFNADLKVLQNDLRPSLMNGKKDADRARFVKEEAGQAVQRGNWIRAQELYSNSYLAMPTENKSEIAIIVANRSAALYHLKYYEQALSDISLSLSLGYPVDLKFKIMDRRAKCYLALKWNNDAIFAFRETISALDDSKLSKEKRQKMQNDAQLMIEILNKSIQMLNPKNKQLNTTLLGNQPAKKPALPSVSGKNHKQFLAAADALEITSNESEGRFAKATRDITVGEIVLTEKAHCSVLLGEYAETHCQHCFIRCIAPIACPTCSNVIFCSDSCQQKALSTYHKYECPILRLIWDSGCSITCHMALRIISQRDLSYFTDLKPTLNEPMTGKYFSNDYKCVYNLVRHEDQRSKADFFQRTHMAVFLLNLLMKSSYFSKIQENIIPGPSDTKLGEVESYIGGLIFRNLQILQFNAHEIFETQCDKVEEGKVVRKDLSKSVFLGGGLYPTLALFNHSCDPGVVRYFQGTSVIAQAIKNITNGQQVAENYGPMFTRQVAAARKAELQERYWFQCHCNACKEEWPLFENMDEGVMRFKCTVGECRNVIPVPINCQDFMLKCGLCQQFTNIFKGLKGLQDTESAAKLARSHMEKGEYGRALVKLIEELRLYDETLAPPFKDYHKCQQNIRKCLLTFGNVSIV